MGGARGFLYMGVHMRRMVAVLVGVLAAAVAAQGALASGDGKITLGPAGYSGPGAKSTLVVAGTANVVLGSDDHVVICHATGSKNGDGFVQIAPSASGVVKGHDKHQDDRDIIPPFSYAGKYGSDAALAAGQNWNAANSAAYANGCRATTVTPPTTPPTDVCPNIEGVQTSIPSGMTKDSAGNCVTTVNLVSTPPTTTVVVEKVIVNTMVVKKVVVQKAKAKKVKKAKKLKVKAKAKKKAKKAKIKVKGVSKKFTPRVLPHTR